MSHDSSPIHPSVILDTGRRLRESSLTAVALTQACLDAIHTLNPELNAFITITEEQALETASMLDRELAAGNDRGPLHGIPLAYKDNIDVGGVRATSGSAYYRNRIAEKDATVVTRLKAAGTVSLGKANMTELGTGAYSGNRFFGAVRNPWNPERSAGGSSNGPAVAVAAGLCLGGIATDSGGSLRQPASWLNLVGIKPTHGLVSRAGTWGKSLTVGGTIGAVTRTVFDNALLLSAMAGHDPDYLASLDIPPQDYTAEIGLDITGIRVGIVDGYSLEGLDAEIAEATRSAIDVLAGAGAQVRSIRIPSLVAHHDHDPYATIVAYEAQQTFGKIYWAEADRAKLFGSAVRRFFTEAREITEEAHAKAQRQRLVETREIYAAFSEVDVIITPTVPVLPPLVGHTKEVRADIRRFSHPFGFAALPSITVPAGISRDRLPIGVQLTANLRREKLLYRVAAAHEAEAPLYELLPPICAAGIDGHRAGASVTLA